MRWLKTLLHQKDFHLQTWIITAMLGILHISAILIFDFLDSSLNLPKITFQLILLLSFSTLTYLLITGKIRKVPVLIPCLLIVLIALDFIRFGGVKGTLDFNVLGAGVFFISVIQRKWSLAGLVFFHVILIATILDIHFNGWFSQHLYQETATQYSNYFVSLITVIVFITFYKSALVKESKRLYQLRQSSTHKNEEIKVQKEALEQQQQLLTKANQDLEESIQRKTKHLQQQSLAIEQYIELSTSALTDPLARIMDISKETCFQGTLEEQLQHTIDELNDVVTNLKNELTHNE